MSLAVVHADLNDAARSVRAKIIAANDADGKSRRHRVQAGLELITLQKRVENGEAGEEWRGKWWKWFSANVGFHRKTGELCIRIAQSDDPDAADEEARRDATERQRKSRDRKRDDGCDVTSISTVDKFLSAIIRIMDALTDEERDEILVKLTEHYQ